MPTIQEVVKHPDFSYMPYEEKRKVFNAIDTDFYSMNKDEQDKVINFFENKLQKRQHEIPKSIPFGDKTVVLRDPFKPMIDLSGGLKADIDLIKKPINVPEASPEWAKKYPGIYSKLIKSKELVSPTAQALSFYAGSLGGPVGAGLASSMEQQAEQAFDVYMGQKPAPAITENLLKSAKDIGWGTTIQGVSTHIGNLKDYVPERIKKFISSIILSKPSSKALEVEKKASALGVNMFPSDVTQSKTLAQIEAGMGRLLGSSNIFQSKDAKNIKNILSEVSSIVSHGGTRISDDDIGKLVYDKVDDYLKKYSNASQEKLYKIRQGVKNIIGSPESQERLSILASAELAKKNKELHSKGVSLYTKRNELLPKEPVELNNTIEAAKKWKKAVTDNFPSELDSQLYKRIVSIIKNKKGIPFDSLSGLKSNINADYRRLNPGAGIGEGFYGLSSPGQSTPVRAYVELANAIERDINVFIKNSGSGVMDAHKEAIGFWRDFRTLTNKPDYRKFIKAEPERMMEHIKDAASIRIAKQAIGEGRFNELVKPEITNRIFGYESTPFNPKEAAERITKYANILPHIYNKKELSVISKAIQSGNIVDARLDGMDIKFLQKIVNLSDPKIIIDTLFTGEKSKFSAHNIDKIYKLFDKKSKDKFKYHILEKIMFKDQPVDSASIMRGGKEYLGYNLNKLSKNIANNKTILNKYFDEKTVDRIKTIAEIGNYYQSAGKYSTLKISETGQSAWALTQLFETFRRLSMGDTVGAIGVLAGPAVVSELYLSRPMAKVLEQGVKFPMWLNTATKYGTLVKTRDDNK